MLVPCCAFALLLAEDAKYNLAPRYVLGQELTYIGVVQETAAGPGGAKYEQPYDLETTALVSRLGAKKDAELCCATMLRLPTAERDPDAGPFDEVAGYRFDHLRVAPSGAAAWLDGPRKARGVSCPAGGWANGEVGFLLEVPPEPQAVGATWTVKRSDAPDLQCTLAGTEIAEGEACLRVVCTEQSRNWERPDSRAAWRATSTILLGQQRGLAVRVLREHEQRPPGETKSRRTALVRYALAANLSYRGPQLQDRVADFELAAHVQGEYERLVSGRHERPARAVLGNLKHDLKLAVEQRSRATPYRPALKELLRSVGAAESALATRKPAPPAPGAMAPAAAEGQPARAIAWKETDGARRSLKDSKGQGIVLVYVNPQATLSRKALADVLAAARGAGKAAVVALCATADDATAKALRDAVPGDYRVAQAVSTDRSYGVKSMPHTIAIDGAGILRANFVGVGPELAGQVSAAMAPLPALGAKDAAPAK